MGLVFSTGEEHWFLRARAGAVVQRLSLPPSPPGGTFLRFLEGRYAIGWGDYFDELVRCP